MSHEDDDDFWKNISPRARKIIEFWEDQDPQSAIAIWDDPYEFLDDEYVARQQQRIFSAYGIDVDQFSDPLEYDEED